MVKRYVSYKHYFSPFTLYPFLNVNNDKKGCINKIIVHRYTFKTYIFVKLYHSLIKVQ